MTHTSAATLPWPDGWAKPKRLRWAVALSYLGLMGMACTCFGAAGLIVGNLIQGAFLLWGGLLCLLFTIQGAMTRVIVRRATTSTIHTSTIPETGETAVVLPYSASLFWLILSLPAMLLGAAGAVAAWSVVAVIETQDASYAVITLASLAAAGYLLASVNQFRSKKITRGYVALSATGIYHRSWALTSFTPWQHVIAVWPFEGDGQVIRVQVASNADGWSRRTSRFWKQAESESGLNLTVRGTYLSVDPALAYHALLFYFNKPHARYELAADAGVQRLKLADFPASPSHP